MEIQRANLELAIPAVPPQASTINWLEWLTEITATFDPKKEFRAQANRADVDLPMVRAARERDRLARAGLFNRERAKRPDFATLINRAERREHRRLSRR